MVSPVFHYVHKQWHKSVLIKIKPVKGDATKYSYRQQVFIIIVYAMNIDITGTNIKLRHFLIIPNGWVL